MSELAIPFFLFGLAAQPYVSLAFEWWLTRPARLSHDQSAYFDHCKGCSIK